MSRIIAIVTGLLGFLLAVLTPLLPVEQRLASISLPHSVPANAPLSVAAPLVGYAPLTFETTITATAVREILREQQVVRVAPLPPSASVLISTIPHDAGAAAAKGLEVKVAGGKVVAVQRGVPLLNMPITELGDRSISIKSDAARTVAAVEGGPRTQVDRDIRPQLVGLFTGLREPHGTTARADLDSRFSSSPSPVKLAAMILAPLLTIAALIALHLLDTSDGRRARSFLPARWWRLTWIDSIVLGILGLWHLIGANTSDDGYILTMARVAPQAGYMANYYRWFGVPEAPFGWYYEVLAVLARISDSSPFIRLPALVAAVLCWLVISREVLPRLGAGLPRNPVVVWTAGLVFLAFWLPYNNGLRPEPIIALGALLTWCSVERAAATGRLLPAAVAVLIAAFSLAAGPTGLICVAALIAGSRPVLRIIGRRARALPGNRVLAYLSLIGPGLAAGTVVLTVVFADQTLAGVQEATRVRALVKPNVAWFDEWTRWAALMALSPDGSLARRFGVLVMLLCLVVCVMQLLRKGGRIPGTAKGPAVRILGVVFGSLLLMSFTPTKWTHHFGVYAGLAGSLAALGAVAVSANGLRSPRNRAIFAAAVSFVLALCFTSSNGWWYVSSYGIPWWDKRPELAGKGIATGFLAITLLALALAAWYHYREPAGKAVTGKRIVMAPLTIAAAFMVLFEVASFLKGAVAVAPGYSIAYSNARALVGKPCALADEVLVEPDANQGLLRPVSGQPVDALGLEQTGFSRDGVAPDLTADVEEKAIGGANSVDSSKNKTSATTAAGTGGGELPFGLRAGTPVWGSYTEGEQQQATLTSQWYRLDRSASAEHQKLLVITAAGRIHSIDADGIHRPGQELRLEYGTPAGTGVKLAGSVLPIDIGPSPSWRNLRVPLTSIPDSAQFVRIVATDKDVSPKQWLAFTPPRLAQLTTLQQLLGRETPVLLDWHVGLAFPCQRPFNHRDGVAEVPRYRILPDRPGADVSNHWQDDFGGGPLGWTGLIAKAETLPTYLDKSWHKDWGGLERLVPYLPAAPAQLTVRTETKSGTWSPGQIRT